MSLETEADLQIYRQLMILLIRVHPHRDRLVEAIGGLLETLPVPAPSPSSGDDPALQGAQLAFGVIRARLAALLREIADDEPVRFRPN